MKAQFLMYWNHFLSQWHHWLLSAAVLAGALILGIIIHRVFFAILTRVTKHTKSTVDDIFVQHSRNPSRCVFPLLMVFLALPVAELPTAATNFFGHIFSLALIASVAWLAAALTKVLRDAVAIRFKIEEQDNLRARRVHTQIMMLRRITNVIIVIITIGLMLMTFPAIRHLGTTLFASAGIVGIVAGIAARPALANLIAGVQIALAEPIRIDDVVIVEGEWGRIEEITTTYVVVRIWDLRRLVLPLAYFIEKPFQNWTRISADLLGTVFIYADYTAPVEEIRAEVLRILKSSDSWDGKVWNLQVTDATEHSIQLRALMSAANSSAAWDLRCLVRERLIVFLQANYPQCLPRTRAELRAGNQIRPAGTVD
jgi:small-conductance mechanosensitive channel